MTSPTPPNRPLHVCIVAPTASTLLPNSTIEATGGAEAQLVHLGKAFTARGCHTTFVIGDFGQPAELRIDDMTVVRCPFRYFGTSWTHYPGDSLRLIRHIRGLQPDVILMKTPRSLTLGLAVATWGMKSRLVHVMASDTDCSFSLWPLPNIAYVLGAKLAHGTVFQSERQASLAGRNLGLKGRVIPNIAHGVKDSIPGSREDKDIDCLWVGTCTQNKDPLAFLDLVQALPVYRFAMAIAPGQDTNLQDRVRQRASTLKNLSYLGFVPYRDTDALFRRARAVVCTSHSEGFPNVFLQAWENRTPVISVHVDPDDVIVNNRLGRVTGSVATLADTVRDLLADEAGRHAMGEAGRRHVLATHAPTVIVDQYLDFFRALGVNATFPGGSRDA